MSNRTNSGGASTLAREIQRRLSQAQGEPATAESAAQPRPATQESEGLRVTKDGQIVQPGQPVPLDAEGNPVSFSRIPDATFHELKVEP